MLISANKIGKSFYLNGKTIVAMEDIQFEVRQGEVITILGPSGSGKSTLLRCLNGLETVDSGELIVGGITVGKHARDLPKLRQRVGMVFQQFHLFSDRSLLENIMLAPRVVRGLSLKTATDEAMVLLERVGLADKAHAFPQQLSGGQQQRGAIARALAMNPEVILFDEPTSALDPEMVEEVQNVIKDLTKAGLTLIIVTHELSFAKEAASRVWFFDKGHLLEDASKPDFFAMPAHPRAQQFLASAF